MKLEPITTSDYFNLKPYFKNQKYELCAYSLPSLIAWVSKEYKPYGGVYNDTLIIGYEYTTQKQHSHLFLPISESSEYGPEELLEIANRLGFEKYWFVPEAYLEKFGYERVRSVFQITEQKEYKDYVYLTEDLSTLKGNKYSKKRNLIHQFEKNYVKNHRIKVEEIKGSTASECVDFLEEWCEERNCNKDADEYLYCEKQAAFNTLKNIDLFDVQGILVRIDRKVSAFGIGAKLTKDMGVLHFQKAFPAIKGLYQFFDKLCATQLFSKYKYINKESDMEIPGLAKAKKSYNPVMMVKSYMLTAL